MPADINPEEFLQAIPPNKLNNILKALESQWEDVLEHITEIDVNSPGDFRLDDCRNARSTGKDRARYMLTWLGNHGMKISSLIRALDEMRLEPALIGLKEPEDLVIVEQPNCLLSVHEGETIKLTCKAKGFPYPRYTWFKNRQESSSGLHGILEIRDARVEDGGHYMCRIHNTGNRAVLWSRDGLWCEVVVKENPGPRPPFFTEQPENELTVKFGDSFELECCVESSTNVSYQWMRDGNIIPNADKPILKISSASHEQEGVYLCCVSNKYAEAKSNESVVRVLAPNQPQPNELDIIENPSDQQSFIGGISKFLVRVDDRLKLNVSYQWFHKGKSMHGETSDTLQFTVSSLEQQGSYQCRVQLLNKTNEVLSEKAELTVKLSVVRKTAEDKVALILAISEYSCPKVKNLPGVYNDAIVTTKQLKDLHFKVYSYLNLTIEEMWAALHIFRDALSEGVYALVYFAGHGFLYNHLEYLMPSNSPEQSKAVENLCIQAVINFLQENKPRIIMAVTEFCLKEKFNIKEVPGEKGEILKACGNWCIIRSNGPDEKAFEETIQAESYREPRGLFNCYFLRAIQQNLSIPEMWKSFKADFAKRPHDKDKYPMTPTLYTDIQDDERSLLDPIETTDKKKMDERNRRWNSIHEASVPSSQEKKFWEFGDLTLTFMRKTTNILEMQYKVSAYKSNLKSISLTGIEVLSEGVECRRMERKHSFCFYNLQRLRDPLVAVLQIEEYISSLILKGVESTFQRQATEQSEQETDSLTSESDSS